MKVVHFRFQKDLAVPAGYAFAWYTDVREDDTQLARHLKGRRIVARGEDSITVDEELELLGRRITARLKMTREPPLRWRVEADSRHGTATSRYRLEPGPGGCRLVIESEWRFTSWVRFVLPFFRRRLERELRAEVDDFAAAVEKDFRSSAAPTTT